MEKTHEIVLYHIDDTNVCVNVYYEDETFWLTTKAMAELFGVKPQAISKHLGNIYEEEELTREATCSQKEQVQQEHLHICPEQASFCCYRSDSSRVNI